MTDAADLSIVDDEINRLLAGVSAGERRKLAMTIAKDLRTANATRIKAQQNPDGFAFAPRKTQKAKQIRAKAGHIKRKAAGRRGRAGLMFKKMGRPSNMKATGTAEEASVGFVNPFIARVAMVSQYGLRDRVLRGKPEPEAAYPVRELLGFTDQDREQVLELVFQQLSR